MFRRTRPRGVLAAALRMACPYALFGWLEGTLLVDVNLPSIVVLGCNVRLLVNAAVLALWWGVMAFIPQLALVFVVRWWHLRTGDSLRQWQGKGGGR